MFLFEFCSLSQRSLIRGCLARGEQTKILNQANLEGSNEWMAILD